MGVFIRDDKAAQALPVVIVREHPCPAKFVLRIGLPDPSLFELASTRRTPRQSRL